jgi:hypothetical protein
MASIGVIEPVCPLLPDADAENEAVYRRVAEENYPGEVDRLFPVKK